MTNEQLSISLSDGYYIEADSREELLQELIDEYSHCKERSRDIEYTVAKHFGENTALEIIANN